MGRDDDATGWRRRCTRGGDGTEETVGEGGAIGAKETAGDGGEQVGTMASGATASR